MLSLCLVFWRWERKLRSFVANVAVALLFNLIFTCQHSPAVPLFIQKIFWCFCFGRLLTLSAFFQSFFIEWSF